MNIKELSIGDWVMYRNREWQVCSLYQFTGEVGLWRKDSQICENVADCKPIPITAEILEKNGFERASIGGVIYRHRSDAEITLYNDGWWHTINLDEYSIHKINGVHQLQHLLRLYGSEKEIAL